MNRKSKWPRGKKPPLNNYIRYSNTALQMMAMMALGIWGGLKLDAWLNTGFPVFTIVFSLLGVFGAIWLFIRNL